MKLAIRDNIIDRIYFIEDIFLSTEYKKIKELESKYTYSSQLSLSDTNEKFKIQDFNNNFNALKTIKQCNKKIKFQPVNIKRTDGPQIEIPKQIEQSKTTCNTLCHKCLWGNNGGCSSYGSLKTNLCQDFQEKLSHKIAEKNWPIEMRYKSRFIKNK